MVCIAPDAQQKVNTPVFGQLSRDLRTAAAPCFIYILISRAASECQGKLWSVTLSLGWTVSNASVLLATSGQAVVYSSTSCLSRDRPEHQNWPNTRYLNINFVSFKTEFPPTDVDSGILDIVCWTGNRRLLTARQRRSAVELQSCRFPCLRLRTPARLNGPSAARLVANLRRTKWSLIVINILRWVDWRRRTSTSKVCRLSFKCFIKSRQLFIRVRENCSRFVVA